MSILPAVSSERQHLSNSSVLDGFAVSPLSQECHPRLTRLAQGRRNDLKAGRVSNELVVVCQDTQRVDNMLVIYLLAVSSYRSTQSAIHTHSCINRLLVCTKILRASSTVPGENASGDRRMALYIFHLPNTMNASRFLLFSSLLSH